MLKYLKRNGKETDEDRVVRFADIMVERADRFGKINKWCLGVYPTIDQVEDMPMALQEIRQELIKAQPVIEGDLEPFKRWVQKNFDDVRLHLLNNGYIDEPKSDTKDWILNEVGKKMKQLKGHKNYQEYIDKKHKAEIAEMNGKIHWKRRALFSAFIGLILGILISWIAIKLGLPTPMRPALEATPPSNPPKASEKIDTT